MDYFPSDFYKVCIPVKFQELFSDGIALERETVTKFLGVFSDENVPRKAHFNTISTKMFKSIGILYEVIDSKKIKLNQLYFSFKHSYLKYANLVCGSTKKNKLPTLYCQQKHLRSLSFKDKLIHCRPLFKEIGELNIYKLNIFKYFVYIMF